MTEDMKSTVISGTPRQNSMKITETSLTIGMSDHRPRGQRDAQRQ